MKYVIFKQKDMMLPVIFPAGNKRYRNNLTGQKRFSGYWPERRR